MCSFYPSPEQIFINLGTPVLGYIWMSVSVCVYVEEFTGGQSKGVSRAVLRLLTYSFWKLEIRESKKKLILFLSISKCLGAWGEGEELRVQERATCTKGKQLHYTPTIGTVGFTLLKFFLCALPVYVCPLSVFQILIHIDIYVDLYFNDFLT